MSWWSDKRVLVTGGSGFVGHAVLDVLKEKDCIAVRDPDSSFADLTKEDQVDKVFKATRPDVVLHLAGRVGGIGVNKELPGEFFYQNIMMGTLMMEYARKYNVEKFVGVAAGCGYPKHLEVPFKESDFWKDFPDENSYGYSMAKKMLVIQSWAYREQYDFESSIVLPANLYGPHDNFHLENAHVVPALIRKFAEGKERGLDFVEVWGTGIASREFLYVEDTARAIVDVAEHYRESGPLNLGTGVGTTIKELAETISELVGYEGEIRWDPYHPDGQPVRYYDMTEFKEALGYIPSTDLRTGLKKTIKWFYENQNNLAER